MEPRDVPASIEPTEEQVITKIVEVRTYAESRRGEAIVKGKHIRA